jgi:hypothetical protein
MYSREDVVKALLSKKGVDIFSTGGVSMINLYDTYSIAFIILEKCT